MIFIFSILINVICLLNIIKQKEYSGDVSGFALGLSSYQAIALSILCFIFYLFIMQFPKISIFSNIKDIDKGNVLVAVEILVIVSLSLKFFGFVFFGYGVAESKSSLSLGFIFRLVPTYVVFMCLLVIPEKFKKRYFFYLFCHIVMMVMMGWTGGLFDIFWLIIFRYMIHKNKTYHLIIIFLTIFVAFLLSPYVYSLKFYIRWGDGFEFEYMEILGHLLSRLSFIPSMLYLGENSNEFVNGVNVLPAFTLLDSITAVLPRSLLGISINNLETLFVGYVTGSINPGVVYYLSLPGKLISSYNISFFELSVSLLVLVYILSILAFLLKSIFGELFFLPWSLIVFKFFLSGNYEEPAYIIYGLCIIFVFSQFRFRFR
ncbi:oligosaccharide repeat unit polymerase [Salinivibrio kushneri]|uniref:oligosaccharide repeat unit polymerase n=1 Tax=Salinivibrio kushneri TaxID=1908198 RepID=UPI000984FFD1|nr:hypothetical protein BZG18_05305 [Salinivibrio kushneri]